MATNELASDILESMPCTCYGGPFWPSSFLLLLSK